MSLSTLLERNDAFAATDARTKAPAIPFIPNQLAYVITCIDPRTEPAGFLGIELGDAIVQRAIGGRVTSRSAAGRGLHQLPAGDQGPGRAVVRARGHPPH
jgi:carbonic anhydrase